MDGGIYLFPAAGGVMVYGFNPPESLSMGLVNAAVVLGGSLVVIVVFKLVKNSMTLGDSGLRGDEDTGKDSDDGASGWGDGGE